MAGLQRGNLVILFILGWSSLVLFMLVPMVTDDVLLMNTFDNSLVDDTVDDSGDSDSKQKSVDAIQEESETEKETSIIVNTDGEIAETPSPVDDQYEYRKNRIKNFNSWFEGNKTDKLIPNADENGTILDFAIVGFAKCGTTTMMANLGYIAPLPVADVCAPVHQTVYYSYINWPEKHQVPGEEKTFRGTKCPAFIQGTWLEDFSKYLPRTKLIVGIRHPVSWFQSFWNMQIANHLARYAGGNPYKITKPCMVKSGRGCRNGCPHRQHLCMHRGRFHLALASLGKTALSKEERKILSATDIDGGENLRDMKVKNPIFIYEQHMLGDDAMWEDLARYIGVDKIPHDKMVTSHGKNRDLEVDFCDKKYDDFRAMMMPIAYEVSSWIQEYFVPVGKDESRTDVFISQPDKFVKYVEEYRNDPCGKLQRLDNGTYVLL